LTSISLSLFFVPIHEPSLVYPSIGIILQYCKYSSIIRPLN